MTQKELEALIERADQAGVRLEIIGGVRVWEASPAMRHQEALFRIQASIKPTASATEKGCGCYHLADVLIRFPDGSLKRPDIAIFCRRPVEQDEAITLVPEAVIEVISQGSEAKDMEFAPYFYLAQGVKDVVIFDPFTLFVLHARRDGRKHHTSPVAIEFECGCQCEV
ncbi:MAG: Uma2 family endonuclease [Chloroflexota bacterium]|nr:Uma2 family endonuclease [Chloroflexota bacterium]